MIVPTTEADLREHYRIIHDRLWNPVTPIEPEIIVEAVYPIGRPFPGMIGHIQSVVARHFFVTIDEIMSHSRHQRVAVPRQIAIYLCRTITKRSLVQIAAAFGGRDHTTIIHSVRNTRAKALSDRKFALMLIGLRNQIECGEQS